VSAQQVGGQDVAGTVVGVSTIRTPEQSPAALHHVARSALWVTGLVAIAAGISATLHADTGLAPADLVTTGVTAATGIELWVIASAFAVLCVCVSRALGAKLRPTTLVAAVLIGPCIGVAFSVEQRAGLSQSSPLGVRVAALAFGLVLIGAGSAFQIFSAYGPSPFDLVTVTIAEKLRWSIRSTRITIDAVLVGTGIALSSSVGVGTIVAMVAVGVVINEVHRRLLRARDRRVGVSGTGPTAFRAVETPRVL
jgi:uncharacterized membrane protein YczE